MLQQTVSNADHIRGNSNAPILLVEYGDFQCPHCRLAYPHIKKTLIDFGDKIAFVSRNFPITESHFMALPAALVAEAAAHENKYWEFIETVYEYQDLLSEGSSGLVKIAEKIGLNSLFVAAALNDSLLLEKVEKDYKGGLESGVKGTPALFINGIKYYGAVNYAELKIAIDDVLKTK